MVVVPETTIIEKGRLGPRPNIAHDNENPPNFFAAFKKHNPPRAQQLVSEMPKTPQGVKTEASDKVVTSLFAQNHLNIGIDSLKQLMNSGLTVKHLRFEV